MTLYGYARMFTTDQDRSLPEASLRAAGCQAIRSERRTGTSREGRSELDLLKQSLRPGDILVVTRIDRLARPLKELQGIVHERKAKGVTLKAIAQAVDAVTAAGNEFLDMPGVFAELEATLRRERQMEGIDHDHRAFDCYGEAFDVGDHPTLPKAHLAAAREPHRACAASQVRRPW